MGDFPISSFSPLCQSQPPDPLQPVDNLIRSHPLFLNVLVIVSLSVSECSESVSSLIRPRSFALFEIVSLKLETGSSFSGDLNEIVGFFLSKMPPASSLVLKTWRNHGRKRSEPANGYTSTPYSRHPATSHWIYDPVMARIVLGLPQPCVP